MNQRVVRKNGNLDQAGRELAIRMKGKRGRGKYASRGIADMAHGINHPLRVVARRIEEAVAADVDPMLTRSLGLIVTAYSDHLYAVSYGWSDPMDELPPRVCDHPECVGEILDRMAA